MNFRHLLAGAVLAVLFVLPSSNAVAGSNDSTKTTVMINTSQREAIHQMPLLQRPDRPGHFYGNTVRRIYRRRHGMGR